MLSSKPKNEVMGKVERKTLKDWLKAKGMKDKDLDLLPDEGTESRNEIATKLVQICQSLPKGS